VGFAGNKSRDPVRGDERLSGGQRPGYAASGKLPDFVSPALSGQLILIGTLTGVTAVVGA